MKYFFFPRIWLFLATFLPALICPATWPAAYAEQNLSIPIEKTGPADDPADDTAIIDLMISTVADWLTRIGVESDGVRRYAALIVGTPAVVVLVLILIILFRPKRPPEYDQEKLKTGTALGMKSKVIDGSQMNLASIDTALTDKQKILKFFFNLFRKQINAEPGCPTELFLVETRPTCPNESYEMRVMQNGEWTVRRMSIGMLGQGGGSRSKCFYVIFDSHLVIKIPPTPITHFKSYNRQVAAEAAIVDRLQPRECIVPNVSVIMESVHKLPYSHELTPDEKEKKYIHLMEVKPAFQEYLKIGGSFAFFMDLTRHFFMSNTLEEIHHGHTSIAQEALQHQDLLWDQHGFVGRYGEDAGVVCHVLRDLYYRCEPKLNELVEEAAIIDDIASFRFKQWFLIHLAGEQLNPKKEDLPVDLINKINDYLREVVKANQAEVNQYRIGVNAYIRDLHFSRHRNLLEGLSANTLDLLAWLGSHSLALRDLKPENLFVAGNPDEFPVFLSDPAKFSIGLIDVETAVPLDFEDKSRTPQPQLAGTPLYATPTHLFSNAILDKIYDNLNTILHLQDWFATIAIIFKIITGENLFFTTAGVFPEIIKRLKNLDPAGPDLDADVGKISYIFWNSASAELREAIEKHLSLFLQIDVRVPDDFIPIIIKALHCDADQLNKATIQIVEEQKLFTDPAKCKFLRQAPVDKIRQMKTKLLQDMVSTVDKDAKQKQMLRLLDRLEKHKAHYERKLEAAALLKAAQTSITADQLLEAMFQYVCSQMHLPHWPVLDHPSKWQSAAHLPIDIATYQATVDF
jgi:serine/threonine protein kinase